MQGKACREEGYAFIWRTCRIFVSTFSLEAKDLHRSSTHPLKWTLLLCAGKRGAAFEECRGGSSFSNRKSRNLSNESHEVFQMKIKEKSKVDLNSICFNFQIHTRYRRVDTGISVYKKIFTPDTTNKGHC